MATFVAIKPVTDWARIMEKAMLKHLPPEYQYLAPQATVMGLCQIDIETKGNPALENDGGYRGLLQAHPKWSSGMPPGWASWDPNAHIDAYAAVMAARLPKADGDLPTCSFTWPSGENGVSTWISTGKTKDGKSFGNHLKYMEKLWVTEWPAMGFWYVGWALSGRRTTPGTVVAGDGQEYEVELAVHDHGGPGKFLRNPWDGSFRYTIDGSIVSRRLMAASAVPLSNSGLMPDEVHPAAALSLTNALVWGTALGVGAGIALSMFKRRRAA